jgi:hypothetical protein
MMLTPFTFTPDRSNEVLEKTKQYLEAHNLLSEISELGWTYQAAQGTVPHTYENLWSGHFFPMIDSWEELQVSFNLCAFGFYKQAMTSLRSGLETGLLSVYWNLNDDGHIVVQNWLKSREDTPRLVDIWKRLSTNANIALFQQKHDIKQQLLNLGFLHDYVHTKGHQYSNRIGLLKSNTQTFEEKGLLSWLSTFREVIKVVTVLHLLKYPIAVIR